MPYCEKCGEVLVKYEKEEFDRDTGERKYEWRCPVGGCSHTGHVWQSYWDSVEYQYLSGFKKAMGIHPDVICRVCGKKGTMGY